MVSLKEVHWKQALFDFREHLITKNWDWNILLYFPADQNILSVTELDIFVKNIVIYVWLDLVEFAPEYSRILICKCVTCYL